MKPRNAATDEKQQQEPCLAYGPGLSYHEALRRDGCEDDTDFVYRSDNPTGVREPADKAKL